MGEDMLVGLIVAACLTVGGQDNPKQETVRTAPSCPEFIVSRVEISGNRTHRDREVFQVLGVSDGAPFRVRDLNLGLRRLNRTGWYKQLTADDVVLAYRDGVPCTVAITVTVQEVREGRR
jgi:outer membrane protein assembly factor BamA